MAERGGLGKKGVGERKRDRWVPYQLLEKGGVMAWGLVRGQFRGGVKPFIAGRGTCEGEMGLSGGKGAFMAGAVGGNRTKNIICRLDRGR